MPDLKRCSRCVLPETWPGITFDSEGVCSVCRNYEKKGQIDWNERRRWLGDILGKYRDRSKISGNKYDCLVGYSGGKDTAYTLWAMKVKYKMRPLAVTWDHGFILSPEGEYNMMEVPKKLDVDHLRFTSGNGFRNAICRRASELAGDFCYHCHLGVGAFPARVSKMIDIPLQVWGEPTAEYGTFGAFKYEDLEEQDYDHYLKIFSAGMTPEMLLPDGYEKRDLEPMMWPDYKPKAIYLGNFEPWDQRNNVEIIMREIGWKPRASENTWCDWDKVDCPFEIVRDYQKYMRRGFGKATFQASKDIREGLITRKQGFELIRQYEGKTPSESLKQFTCETGISNLEEITSRRI